MRRVFLLIVLLIAGALFLWPVWAQKEKAPPSPPPNGKQQPNGKQPEVAPAPQAGLSKLPLSGKLPQGKLPVTRRAMPWDAAAIALADAKQFDPVKDRPFLRYLFLDGTPLSVQVNNWVSNLSISQSLNIQFAVWIHPHVLRIDLRRFAPVLADLENLIKTWEELAFDPYFHEFFLVEDATDKARDAAVEALKTFLPLAEVELAGVEEKIRKQWLEFLKLGQLQLELAKNRVFDLDFLREFVKQADAVIKSLHPEKHARLYKAVKALRDAVQQLVREAEKTQNVQAAAARASGQGGLGANEEIAVPARHAGADFAALSDLLNTDAPIVYAPYFVHRATTTIDRGHGAGLYYRFANLRLNLFEKDGLNDFQRLLVDLGADYELVKQLKAKNSSVQFFSQVTGRERAVRYIQGIERPASGGGSIVYTEDPSDEQVRAANSPIRNLLAFEFAASEVISSRRVGNGMLLFTLFNAAGAIQNSAPENVVCDHSSPRPYTRRLDACSTCLRCHGPNRGHQIPLNDLLALTSAGADILDDLTSAEGLEEFFDQLVAEYNWDPSLPGPRNPLVRSRDDFDAASFRATGAILRLAAAAAGERPVTIVQQLSPAFGADIACEQYASYFAAYAYTLVTSQIALAELGYEVPSEAEAKKLIRQVLPSQPPDGFGLTLLDPHIEALRAGIPITRSAWELVYADAALRAIMTAGLIGEQELSHERASPNPSRPLKKRPFIPLKTRIGFGRGRQSGGTAKKASDLAPGVQKKKGG